MRSTQTAWGAGRQRCASPYASVHASGPVCNYGDFFRLTSDDDSWLWWAVVMLGAASVVLVLAAVASFTLYLMCRLCYAPPLLALPAHQLVTAPWHRVWWQLVRYRLDISLPMPAVVGLLPAYVSVQVQIHS